MKENAGIRRSNYRCAGFTIAELLMVILVISILTAITVPVLIGLGRGASMRSAVHNMRSSLGLGRQWAITHKETVTFIYDPGTSTEPSYYILTNSSGSILRSNSLPMDVEMNMPGSITSITFKTDGGLASGAASPSIVIWQRENHAISNTIIVYGLTGGIRVK